MKPSTLATLAGLAVLIAEITPEVRERCADTTCAKIGAALRDVQTEIAEADASQAAPAPDVETFEGMAEMLADRVDIAVRAAFEAHEAHQPPAST